MLADVNSQRAKCRCECGTEHLVRYTELKSGKSKSCRACANRAWGEIQREAYPDFLREQSHERRKKRQREQKQRQRDALRTEPKRVPYTPLEKKLARAINQWKVRCTWKKATGYPYYGARGIEFRFASIEEALIWVLSNLGPCPLGRSIDRIDNDRHYEPGNLRWATKSEQMLNRRKWKCRPCVRHS